MNWLSSFFAAAFVGAVYLMFAAGAVIAVIFIGGVIVTYPWDALRIIVGGAVVLVVCAGVGAWLASR